MHYPKLQILIDHLQSVDESDFNMGDFHPNRPCCIGGHASRILYGDMSPLRISYDCGESIVVLCDLPPAISYKIAYNYPRRLINNPTSKDISVRMLENLRDTGEVNWGV